MGFDCEQCIFSDDGNAQPCYLQLKQEAKDPQQLHHCFSKLNHSGPALLEELYLRDANLKGISIQFKNLKNSDLRGADLHQAYLHKVKFDHSLLDGVNLEDAFLDQVDLRLVKSLKSARWFHTIFSNVLLPEPISLGLSVSMSPKLNRIGRKQSMSTATSKKLIRPAVNMTILVNILNGKWKCVAAIARVTSSGL